MTKPNKRPRLELRVFLDREIIGYLQLEARQECRSVTGQMTLILSKRYSEIYGVTFSEVSE